MTMHSIAEHRLYEIRPLAPVTKLASRDRRCNASEYISTGDMTYFREYTTFPLVAFRRAAFLDRCASPPARYPGARNPRVWEIDIRPIATGMSNATVVVTQSRAASRDAVITLRFAVRLRCQIPRADICSTPRRLTARSFPISLTT